MYRQLSLAAVIVLIAFVSLLPFVSLAHLGPGPHLHTHCSDCGVEAHMDAANCIRYVHASDCQCSECIADAGEPHSFVEDVLVPGTNELPGTDSMRGLMNYISYHWSNFWDGISNSDTPN